MQCIIGERILWKIRASCTTRLARSRSLITIQNTEQIALEPLTKCIHNRQVQACVIVQQELWIKSTDSTSKSTSMHSHILVSTCKHRFVRVCVCVCVCMCHLAYSDRAGSGKGACTRTRVGGQDHQFATPSPCVCS